MKPATSSGFAARRTAHVTAFAGDWGRVTRVNGDASLDINVAGDSRAKDSGMPRAVAVARRRVEPCDEKRQPRPRGAAASRRRRPGMGCPRASPGPRWLAAALIER